MQEHILKEFDTQLQDVIARLHADLGAIRGSRPSLELLEDVRVNYYDQMMQIKQLGSLSVVPPRDIHISAWDQGAVPAIVKAIDQAKIGFSVSNDGNVIRASLSSLGSERREELSKLVKKHGEETRIQIRNRRDETMKKIKRAEEDGEMSEDAAFTMKEKAQDLVGKTNAKVEEMIEKKLQDLQE
jgi:ribosome recycling factor